MAFFIAIGIISNDIVRKETRKGVLTTFRLETGAPRGRKLWIGIECWGHLAGTIAHHATRGQGVNVSGRLTQKSWRDKASGEARQRIVVTASDVDLVHRSSAALESVPNSVLLRGTVESVLPSRIVRSGTVSCFRVTEGRAGSKTGRLLVRVEHWIPLETPGSNLEATQSVAVLGILTPPYERSISSVGAVLAARTLAFT